mmetsp:Transcript_19664/g.27090  ORF Transcript_19664/g.27090 Transcript_19664/m.27090 type:complete len:241 (-) Transcript_19664:438-1160(-)|eukprot:CAMPEP_0194587926 /NCGR_PEP_ID=MMETSP0292-20121207/19456_1 /TAXON_ID=39354 /ORGANISM="Heterosigma akashiwo, Strain CCMP2393" /LENGTH=240 /DNA_ID=CAMNT_0039444293 /DNA_START=57 /DNA_END=779 /DNA_ORIENTATION=-
MSLANRSATVCKLVLRNTRFAERAGLSALKDGKSKGTFLRHRPVMNLFEQRPRVCAEDVYVAPSASVTGDVDLCDMASVWYGAVIKGDRNKVTIGPGSNVQDRAVIYTTDSLESGFPAEVIVGANSTIGPGAVLYSCSVGDGARVGAGARVLQGARVEHFAEVAPGAVVPPGRLVPSGQVWGGNPAAFERTLGEGELAALRAEAEATAALAKAHLDEFLHPKWGTAHWDAEKIKAEGGEP